MKNPPPLGFLHRLVVEKEGEHKDRLNLKLKAIAPIVDLARLFALEKGLPETGTLERLRALREQHTIVGRYGAELEQAFEFLMFLRIHHQQAQVAAGREPDNFVDPNELSALERKTAREVFGLVAKVQGLVIAALSGLAYGDVPECRWTTPSLDYVKPTSDCLTNGKTPNNPLNYLGINNFHITKKVMIFPLFSGGSMPPHARGFGAGQQPGRPVAATSLHRGEAA